MLCNSGGECDYRLKKIAMMSRSLPRQGTSGTIQWEDVDDLVLQKN
jgi:hypothetical protein